MDTAAAAAAAVVVDLKPDQQLLGSSTKPRIGGGTTGCDCLGSTVETMSLTPPPTPPTRATDGHLEACGAPGIPSAPVESHSLNGVKSKEAPETATASTEPTQPDMPATSSTSSPKASTTPTSALLGSGTATGSVVPAAEHPPAAASTVPSSSSSGSGSSSSSTSSSGSDENVVQLLPWQDMPTYLQFNPYVLRGYRPLQTFKGCLLSLFYWHNETINILTHGFIADPAGQLNSLENSSKFDKDPITRNFPGMCWSVDTCRVFTLGCASLHQTCAKLMKNSWLAEYRRLGRVSLART
ncbi:spore coat protein SP96 isoform X3 [Drosophila yakuba]|uniref:spore coat protein SP96 isoform X3 n=1 Tax=Drosophila yakuba TaxID=7245 RepID=UPI0019308351|nr:spore coat protein SP96 isoform X3 [Drosophila yakuba]